MALSQIQCLDDNHVNPRTHESKAEFLYCEDQRLALETLLRDGREAFFKELEARGLRGFLSDLELDALAGTVEPYEPGVELYREDPEDEQTPLSLHYWPDLSDMSTPELDMGWPDSEAYRGVTRTTVHTHPPLDGHTHIKEVIRKTIAQAQKVIAVVMDVFTDVDIFRDLLDASFKRKVSVYILLDRAAVPHFLSMCQRANMHTGHLKNLRVRCSGGTDFYTRSCTKVRGHMGHRFMFVDGDKAVSGSYSFTWMASRLDRNLITVVTGQAVDAFDRLFRLLYTSSRLVNLRQVATEPEPEPDPVPQPAAVAPPSAAVARKLYNPKYALVAAANPSLSPSSSAGNNSPKESQRDSKNEAATKKGRRKQSKDTVQEAPPLHPGLVDLEKVYLFDYLPIWPEPDPSSDVIGFINIRDTSKPAQIHLQRSQMFEVSQAIRFSSPFSGQKETLPEVATPRNSTPLKQEENAPQPQQKTPLEPITPNTDNLKQSESDKENANALSKKTPLQSPAKKNHSSIVNSNPLAPSQSVKTVTTPTVSADSPQTEEKMNAETSVLNSKSTLQNRNDSETNHAPKLFDPSDSKSEIKTQKHNSNENTSPTGYIPVTSTSAAANYQVSQATAVHSTLTSASPTLTAISTSVSKLNTNSPIAPSPVAPPPIPKPRTVQLVIKDSPKTGQKMPDVSFVKKEDKEATVHNEPLVAIAPTPKETEKVPELANKSASKSIPQKSTGDCAVKAGSQEKECTKSQEEVSVDAGDKAELQLLASSKEITKTNTEASKGLIEAKVSIDKDVPKKDVVVNAPKGIIIKKAGSQEKESTKSQEKVSVDAGDKAELQLLASSKEITKTNTEASKGLIEANVSIDKEVPKKGVVFNAPKGIIIKKAGSQEKESTKSQEKVSVDAGDKAELQLLASSKEITKTNTEASKGLIEANVSIDKDVPKKDVVFNAPKGIIIKKSDLMENKPEEIPILSSDVAIEQSQASSKIGRTYRARANVPQRITYSSSEENIDLINSPINRSPVLKMKSESTPIIAAETQGDVFKVDESVPRIATFNSRSPLLSPRVPKKPTLLHLNTSEMTDSTTKVKESNTINKTLFAQRHSPITDGFPPRIPTPDSRRSRTPDFQTPTSDVSDGYGSTTSDEFYECSESPFRESIDQVPFYSLNALEDKEIAVAKSCESEKQVDLLSNDRTMSSCETLNLSTKGSLSSIQEKMDDEEKLEKENMQVREEIRKSNENFKLQVVKDTNQSQSNKALKQSVVVEQSSTPKRNNEETETKRMPVRELKPKRVYSRAEPPNRVPAGGEKTGLGTGEVERMETAPPANKEPEGHKQQQQRDTTALVQTRPAQPSRPPRPLSATQSTLARPPGQRAERKMSDGNLPTLDGTSSSPWPRKLPPRPPAPKAHANHHHRQPPASPAKSKPGQAPNTSPLPRPQPSFLYKHTQNMQQTHISPSHQAQAGAIPVGPGLEEEKTAFGITFGKFYNLKGLKDKMSKLPTQSRRSSSSGSTQQRKSTG